MDNEKILELFRSPLVVVNVGPKSFADVLEQQGYETVQVDWKPAAGGDKQMQELLALLGGF